MKTFKEYPATHSMATSWYCVDEDGNVGVFDIEDNGPVPVGEYRENCVEEVFWDDFSRMTDEGIRVMELNSEQLDVLLSKPNNNRGEWEKSYGSYYNYEWGDSILKIDISKYDIFIETIKKNVPRTIPICLSKEQGVFYVHFSRDKAIVDTLERNEVIISKYRAPMFFADVEDINPEAIGNELFPFYIYVQDYALNYSPAEKMIHPKNPLRLEQLPPEIRKNIKTLPIKFAESEKIQLAELLPVESIWSIRYVYKNQIWWELASSKGGLIYYNEESHTIICEEDMKKYLQTGEAEEWDYDKHKDL